MVRNIKIIQCLQRDFANVTNHSAHIAMMGSHPARRVDYDVVARGMELLEQINVALDGLARRVIPSN